MPAPGPGGPLHVGAAGPAVRVAGAPGTGIAGPGQQQSGTGGSADSPLLTRMTKIDDLDPARRKELWKAKHQAQARQGDRASERADAILRQIKIHLSPGMRRASIDLEPRELGRLQIQLRLSGERLEAHVRGESREALDLIEKHLPELRSALAEQGLEVSDFRLAHGFGDSAETSGERGGLGGGRRGPDRGDGSLAAPRTPAEPNVIERLLGDTIDLYA